MAKIVSLTLICVAALAVGRVVRADEEDYFDASRDQTGSIPNFPFRNCNTTNGVYRLAPVWQPAGSAKYCFKISVNQDAQSCSGACCNSDLHKIEFNVSNSCLVAGSSVIATINGVPTRVGAAFDKPPSGANGTAILRITQLGLTTATAQNAELCITLKTNRAGQGCNTLERLCSSPGFPAGTCTAATFDVACDCCPISQAGQPSPPPPIVPSYRPCSVCITATLQPPPNDIRPYRYDDATCSATQQIIADEVNALLGAANINIAVPFAPNSTQCFDKQIAICGKFNGSDAVALNDLTAAVQHQIPAWIAYASGGSVCSPQLEGYEVTIATEGEDGCLEVSQSLSCFLPRVPFPNCTCNTTQGVLPFTVSPTYYARNSTQWGKSVTEYCFAVNTLSPAQVVNSTCYEAGDLLAKIEWYADDSIRSAVKGYKLYPANSPSVTKSPSWGAPGTNTLKVTLNWTTEQADGGVVCVAVANTSTMEDLCLGALDQQCYVSVFNRDNSDYCCPIFRTGP